MKNFQQNLFVVLGASLCMLCAYQWYGQTIQRNQVQSLNQLLYEKSVAIQDYTNSIATMNRQIAQMDARITELKGIIKTNEEFALTQKREINQLQITGESLTNQITQYREAVETLKGRLQDAYDGIKKQNDAIKEITAQRDEFIQKLNDAVKDRNDVVAKYNDLVDRVQKLQSGSGKTSEK